MLTRPSPIAVVRRLFKMGLKSVERRLIKTLRRLFHPLPAEIWSMLIYDDANLENVQIWWIAVKICLGRGTNEAYFMDRNEIAFTDTNRR